MPASYFCPRCWGGVPRTAALCPHCGADLAALNQAEFEEKLIRALDHPEPQTAARAAAILGRRGSRKAVPALLSRYRAQADPYLAAEIATALGRIGGPDSRRALAALGRDRSVVVARAVREALADLGRAAAACRRRRAARDSER